MHSICTSRGRAFPQPAQMELHTHARTLAHHSRGTSPTCPQSRKDWGTLGLADISESTGMFLTSTANLSKGVAWSGQGQFKGNSGKTLSQSAQSRPDYGRDYPGDLGSGPDYLDDLGELVKGVLAVATILLRQL